MLFSHDRFLRASSLFYGRAFRIFPFHATKIFSAVYFSASTIKRARIAVLDVLRAFIFARYANAVFLFSFSFFLRVPSISPQTVTNFDPPGVTSIFKGVRLNAVRALPERNERILLPSSPIYMHLAFVYPRLMPSRCLCDSPMQRWRRRRSKRTGNHRRDGRG